MDKEDFDKIIIDLEKEQAALIRTLQQQDQFQGSPASQQWRSSAGLPYLLERKIEQLTIDLQAKVHEITTLETHLRGYRRAEDIRSRQYIEATQKNARNREELLDYVSELVPLSVFPSGIVDDPNSPPTDEVAAEHFKDAIRAFNFEEAEDFFKSQSKLKELIDEQRYLNKIERKAEQESANQIQKLLAELKDSHSEANDLRDQLETHQGIRNQVVHLETKIEDHKEGRRVKEAKAKVTFGFSSKATASVDRAVQQKATDNDTLILDLREQIARLKDEAAKAEAKEEEQKKRIAEVERRFELPAEVIRQQRVNMQEFCEREGLPLMKWPRLLGQLKKKITIGSVCELLMFTRRDKKKRIVQDHARRNLAFRAGILENGKTKRIIPTEQLKNPKGGLTNQFDCEWIMDDGESRPVRICIGVVTPEEILTHGATVNEEGKLYIMTVLPRHPDWSPHKEDEVLDGVNLVGDYSHGPDELLEGYEKMVQALNARDAA